MSGVTDFLGQVFEDVRGDLGNAYSEILTQDSPITADYDPIPGEPIDLSAGLVGLGEGNIIDADYVEISEPALPAPDSQPQIEHSPEPPAITYESDTWEVF